MSNHNICNNVHIKGILLTEIALWKACAVMVFWMEPLLSSWTSGMIETLITSRLPIAFVSILNTLNIHHLHLNLCTSLVYLRTSPVVAYNRMIQ